LANLVELSLMQNFLPKGGAYVTSRLLFGIQSNIFKTAKTRDFKFGILHGQAVRQSPRADMKFFRERCGLDRVIPKVSGMSLKISNC